MKIYKTDICRAARFSVELLSVVVISLAMAFALTSCTKEPLLPGEQQAKEYMDFSMELTPPGAYTPTKAMTTGQQNAVNRAEVLVFQSSVLLYHKTGTVTDIDGVKKRVQVSLKTSQTETELFDIMVIGNPPTFDFAPYVGKTKDELKAAFNVSVAGKWTGSEFVMFGEARQTLIKPTTHNFEIQMLRSLARVDVGLGYYYESTDIWSGLTDFKLTEVRVVNSRNKFAAIPSATTFNESGNVKVNTPTIPADAAAQGKTAADAVLYNGADVTSGNYTNSTIFIAEAPNATDRVTLLIGGSYKGGATTFYRVDMCVPKAGASGSYDYLNILRNHLYRITIKSVMGAGYTDAQEALISAPLNITTTLTEIVEGGAGADIVFDGNNYIMTDASNVEIYGRPYVPTTYKIATVKANFDAGVVATVSGTGLAAPIKLTSGVKKTIEVTLARNNVLGTIVVKVGRLTKTIRIKTYSEIDAHFDYLGFNNVSSMIITNPQHWITLSQNMTYLPSEQQSAIVNNVQNTVYVHFDENIATSGTPRMAQALLLSASGAVGTTRIFFEQRNLSGMVLGYFGGAKNDYGYTKQVAIEPLEEYNNDNISKMTWGFGNVLTGASDKTLGTAATISLAKRTDSGITGPYTNKNTYPARYCYDKNRDTNGNGVIDDSEVVWYLPAQDQLMSAWIAYSAVTTKFSLNDYWSATENNFQGSWSVDFITGKVFTGVRGNKNSVRCFREL